MSLFNPVKGQHSRLLAAAEGKNYISLEEAGKAMQVSPRQVGNSLLLMEQKGLFTGSIPFVDDALDLVYMNKGQSDGVYTMGVADCILSALEKARMALPNYEAYRESKRRAGKAKNLENAIYHFAEEAIGGKKIVSNLKDAARSYMYRKRLEEDSLLDMDLVLDRLQDGAYRLRDYAEKHPSQPYPEKFRHWFTDMYTGIKAWTAAVDKPENPQERDRIRFYSEKLAEEFALVFPEMERMLAQLQKQSPHTSLTENVRSEIALSLKYLAEVRDVIRDVRTHAAVVRIIALLEQLDRAYCQAGEGFSPSDAKSLKNIYLPMLRSLLDKYVSYEQQLGRETGQTYKPGETLSVLENELPRALNKIRDELQRSQASAMEDEATALRRKLELDGLL